MSGPDALVTVLTGVGAGVCALATWLRMGPRHAPAAAATAGATTAAAGPLNAMLGLGAAAMLLGAVLHLQPRDKTPAKVRRRSPLRRGADPRATRGAAGGAALTRGSQHTCVQ